MNDRKNLQSEVTLKFTKSTLVISFIIALVFGMSHSCSAAGEELANDYTTVPLNMPNMGEEAILAWSKETLIETLQLQNDLLKEDSAPIHFSLDGWVSFQKAASAEQLDARKVADQIKILTPTLKTKYLLNATYHWVIAFKPISTSDSTTSTPQELSIRIRRVPKEESAVGVSIVDVALMPDKFSSTPHATPQKPPERSAPSNEFQQPIRN